MIDALQRFAERLAFVRPVFLILGIAGLLAAAWEGLGSGFGAEDYLIPSLVLILWSIVGFASIGLFRDVPPPEPNGEGVITRLKHRLSRAFFWLLALVFIALTLTGLYMTYKLISIYTG